MTNPEPRFYNELAKWWPLLSPPEEYEEEAADLLARLPLVSNGQPLPTLLELGSGGGSLASHLGKHFRLTLSDIAPAMLEISRAINPECEHVVGDMRSLRLDRQFDVVLIHDAIMYAITRADLQATLNNAARHLRVGGTIAVLPDCLRESFEPSTDHGGHDADDGRGLRYLEWSWDPDPDDDTSVTDYVFVLRGADGVVTLEHERHVEGLFSREVWLQSFASAGLEVELALDPFGREIFIGKRNGESA